MDKLRAIRFFCRTVETNSFTVAARSLDVPQSVLSKSIAALEAELEITLLNRSTRRLSVTDAGARYYSRCRQILLDFEEAESALQQGGTEPAGTLRIGIHPVFQISLCARLNEFLAANPRVSVELVHRNSPAALLDQGLDLILRIGEMPDSSLVARRLGSAEPIVCAAPGYLAKYGRPTHPHDLLGHRAIIPGRLDEDPFTRWVFTKGKQREVIRVPVGVVLHEGVGLGLTAAGGVGLVRIYDIAARPFVEQGSLVPVLRDWSGERQPVFAVMPAGRNPGAKVRAFIEFAQTLLVPEPANEQQARPKRLGRVPAGAAP